MAGVLLQSHHRSMKSKKMSQDQNQKMANTQQSTIVVASNQTNTDFKPSPDAVAKRAYFSYLNEGSIPGHDERHWLEAEAHLVAEIAREKQAH
jgi:hypothetical protein